jgi:nicotinamide-nucleotide amidase
VAYCAHQWRVDVRLSSPDGRLSMLELQAIADECARCWGGFRVLRPRLARQGRCGPVPRAGEDARGGGIVHGRPARQRVHRRLRRAKFFRGAVVCYSNDAKMQILDVPESLIAQHGAVSDECAVALATSVAETLEADYGLAITGYAGSTGGDRGSPVGTIFLGLHSPQGVWSKKLNYTASRTMVNERAITVALDWLRRELCGPRAIPACRRDGSIEADGSERRDEPPRRGRARPDPL